jgi:hypothetical protein
MSRYNADTMQIYVDPYVGTCRELPKFNLFLQSVL